MCDISNPECKHYENGMCKYYEEYCLTVYHAGSECEGANTI